MLRWNQTGKVYNYVDIHVDVVTMLAFVIATECFKIGCLMYW